jgi:hypothetical protein
VSGEFVAKMEDVLDLYELPYVESRPTVCVDESPKQLLADTREPLPPAPGRPARQDHEYKRNGMQEVFVCCEPKAGLRRLEVKAQRTTKDFAHFMKRVADEFYPHADCIVVVLDNLNTHKPGAFYETFAPEEARRLARRFEFHYTPKHGSWLNMAEIELAVLSKVCLERRIADASRLKNEIAAYERNRNQARATIDWRFTTPDARQKMRRVYPLNSSG